MKRSGTDAAISMIGLALKGGNAAVGRAAVRESLRRRNASGVFLAADAGEALVDEIRALCERYRVPMVELGSRGKLGSALGRIEVAVVALTDKRMFEAVFMKIENSKVEAD